MPVSQRRGRLVARLRRRKTREREGLVMVEGVRAAGECLDAGAEVRFGLVTPRLADSASGRALLDRLAAAGVDVEEVAEADLAELSHTEQAQGILLVCAEPAAGLDTVKAGGRYVVLDAVQDPGNVGTLIRAAAAFGLDATLVLDGTADPWGPKAVRASAGTAFRMPIVRTEASDAVSALAGSGVPVLLADPAGRDVGRLGPSAGGFALVLGNEGAGVRDAVRSAASRAVALPMRGGVESLNVAVAGSILLYLLTAEAEGER